MGNKIKVMAWVALLTCILALVSYVMDTHKCQTLIWTGSACLVLGILAFQVSNKIELDKHEKFEADLRLSEARKKERAILENAVDVICIIDVSAKFQSLSPSAERAWGYLQDELIGHSLSEFLEGGETDESLAKVLGAQNSIDKIVFENRLRHKNGTYIDLSWSAHWSASDNGLFCVAHDISKRKQAELQLLESEQQKRSTMEAIPAALACTNTLGQIEYANRHLEDFAGRLAIDLLGSQISNLFGNESSKVHSFINSCTATKEKPNSIEVCLEKEKGEKYDFELVASTFTVNGQNKLLITITDISNRKQVQRLKQQFLSMVSHDLKTPLASLAGMIAILRSGTYGKLEAGGLNLCDLAESELQRLLELVRDLLDLEKIESKDFPLNVELVSVQDIIEASVSSVKTFAALRNISIRHDEYESACRADRQRIIQVLVNLLSNAIKFTPDSSTIDIAVDHEKSGAIRFVVTDQGRGIPPGSEQVIFQRFRQVNSQDSARYDGSGLGLAISKAIVEAHGGNIGFTNLEPQGCSFWFTLN